MASQHWKTQVTVVSMRAPLHHGPPLQVLEGDAPLWLARPPPLWLPSAVDRGQSLAAIHHGLVAAGLEKGGRKGVIRQLGTPLWTEEEERGRGLGLCPHYPQDFHFYPIWGNLPLFSDHCYK